MKPKTSIVRIFRSINYEMYCTFLWAGGGYNNFKRSTVHLFRKHLLFGSCIILASYNVKIQGYPHRMRLQRRLYEFIPSILLYLWFSETKNLFFLLPIKFLTVSASMVSASTLPSRQAWFSLARGWVYNIHI